MLCDGNMRNGALVDKRPYNRALGERAGKAAKVSEQY